MHLLWLKTELLHPVDKGGKIRTYNMLKHLRRTHRITYLTLDNGKTDGEAAQLANEYCHELICVPHRPSEKFTAGFYANLALNLITPLPYAIKKYQSSGMLRAVASQARRENFDLLVCDFLAPAVNVPEDLGCPSILFQHNVEAMIWKRHYQVQSNPVKKAYLYGQWRKMRAFERNACHRFDCVVAVSSEDAAMIMKDYEAEAVYHIPTGVDTAFFRPTTTVRPGCRDLVFTGSMDWLPNADAMTFFIEQIMPRIKTAVPDVRITVVGRNPYPRLLEFGRQDPSIIVTGRVEDVRPYIERAATYVVPLRIGGGTRLKIFEAMAMERPIVSTTIGAEGLPISHEEELLLADTPESFAQAVIRLLTDEVLARKLAQRAAATVREKFGWDRAAEDFGAICELAIDPRRKATRPLIPLKRQEQPTS